MINLLAALLILMLGGGVVADAAERKEIRLGGCENTYSLDRANRRPAVSDCKIRVRSKGGGFVAEISNAEVAPDERHTVAIFYTEVDLRQHICTGVLLDNQHVLTAGHCGCGIAGTYEVSFVQRPLHSNVVQNPIKLEGAPILFDPFTCLVGARPGSDLALLKLAADILEINTESYGYPAYALAANLRTQLVPGRSLKVVGFGATETGSLAVRMKANIPVLTSNCLARPYQFACAPFLEMILAERSGTPRPRDTCGGDSGGPVFAKMAVTLPNCDPDAAKKTVTIQDHDVLVGITSRAAPFTHIYRGQHCGGGGIYTLIGRRSVHAWFKENNVKEQKCVPSND